MWLIGIILIGVGALLCYNPFLLMSREALQQMVDRHSTEWVENRRRYMRFGGLVFVALGIWNIFRWLFLKP